MKLLALVRSIAARRFLAVAMAVLAWSIAPASAQACSALTQIQSVKKYPNKRLAPLAIGDSTMILSAPRLSKLGFRVDAKGCRTLEQGIEVMRGYKSRNRLPHLVVIALGANRYITGKQLRIARKVIGPRRRLALVVPRERGGTESHDAVAVRKFAAINRDDVISLDWVRYSRTRHSWFYSDRLHMTPPGAYAYANFLARALPFAMPPPKAVPAPAPAPSPTPAPAPAPAV